MQLLITIWEHVTGMEKVSKEINLLTEIMFAKGVEKNLEDAIWHFKLAAEAGHMEAQYNLGMSYLKGTGTSKNSEQALRYLEMASNQGKGKW
jgi:TPR repeat protein